MQRIKIVSTGLYLPPRKQTASELAPLLGRSEKWIISRTGVVERRIAEEPMDSMAASYGFPAEKTVNIVQHVGNTIATSIPMALATADAKNMMKRGDLILLGGTVAGLSVAFAIIRW
ncbi:hypothetical protein JXA02_14080 [candidate division KSB1 bacterium]|nr:hypothetical protein [candidate division KSB1 bacterium]